LTFAKGSDRLANWAGSRQVGIPSASRWAGCPRYEEIVKAEVASVLALCILLTACSSGLRSEKAVREAIEAHLKSRSDLAASKMTLEIENVKFGDNSAQADTKFRSKDDPGLAVSVHYTLRHAGDHWEVVSSSSANGAASNPHATGAAAPTSPPAAPAPAVSH